MTLPKSLRMGDVVAERFELLDVVGEGTTGTVFHARETSTSREVALKVIHPHLSADRQIVGRFRREVDILGRLRGAHLCGLIECIDQDDGMLIIVLEYRRGGSLDAFIEQHGPLSPIEAAIVVGQICTALEVAHDAGVIHRDLKPSNVLIDSEPSSDAPSFGEGLTVSVVDFGLAKILHGETVGTALTELDMIFGTPAYMSPEQVRGEELDARCDVYATGVILFELLVGRVPFDSPSALGTMTAHLYEAVPVPGEEAEERVIPGMLNRVALCALAKIRENRFASSRHMGEALAACIESLADDEKDPGSDEPSQQEAKDTIVDVKNDDTVSADKPSVGTTMQSKLSDVPVPLRPRVSIRVSEAPISSSVHSSLRVSRGLVMFRESGGERRVWATISVVALLAALIAGIWLGIR